MAWRTCQSNTAMHSSNSTMLPDSSMHFDSQQLRLSSFHIDSVDKVHLSPFLINIKSVVKFIGQTMCVCGRSTSLISFYIRAYKKLIFTIGDGDVTRFYK